MTVSQAIRQAGVVATIHVPFAVALLLACTQRVLPPETVGAIESPATDVVTAADIVLSGWALDPSGVERVEVLVDGERFLARYGVARDDVAQIKADYPDAATAGFEFSRSFDHLSGDRHELTVSVVNRRGRETILGKRSIIESRAMSRWVELLENEPAVADRRFHFLMAVSALPLGGAKDADTEYSAYQSQTLRTGIAVPILYLRTTRGAKNDWLFDPDFEPTHKCRNRLVAEDSLARVISFAIEKRLPVQFILNGGVWADSSCDSPEWDVNDHLEQDPYNCQWTQDNVVYPDDYLKNLTGSVDSPELARVLSYNIYQTQVRYYKKRNLQMAATIVAEFARNHPDLFVGINLDADTYMNPFFEEKEWFDYNPGTIKQFRHWLRGSGPYGEKHKPGTPNLASYRRERSLTLAEVNRIAHKKWSSWDSVDPPRSFPGTPHDPLPPGQAPIWDDPWYQLWDAFRKHLVGLHYDELSQWVRDAGIPPDRIFSAQGFMAPSPGLNPFAVRLTSHGQNYDSAGVSIEGAIPNAGHLGAILYGESAENRARMEVPHSLFATFARMDEGWAVAEFNSTDLKRPTVLPTYAQTYRSFRDLFNYDAKQITVMAWNGSNGANAGQPGYLAYTAWRNTPAEEAMRNFLVSHANLPRGAKLWTFGSSRYADDDGWSAERGKITAGPGYIDVLGDAADAVILSPPDQVIRTSVATELIIGFNDPRAVTSLRVLARATAESPWYEIASPVSVEDLPSGAAGVRVSLSWPQRWHSRNMTVEQLRIEMSLAPGASRARVERIAIYPRDHLP